MNRRTFIGQTLGAFSGVALVPSAARPWTDTVVQQAIDGPAGRVRIAAFNPHATAATLSPARSRAVMAAVSVEVRRERGIASLNVFCSH